MSSLLGNSYGGVSSALPAPPTMMSSLNSMSMNNSASLGSGMDSFRKMGGTSSSSAALQNAVASLQGSANFNFAQNTGTTAPNPFLHQQQQGSSGSGMPPPQSHQQQLRQQQQQHGQSMSSSLSNMQHSLSRSQPQQQQQQIASNFHSSSSQQQQQQQQQHNMGNATFGNSMPPPMTPQFSSMNSMQNPFFSNQTSVSFQSNNNNNNNNNNSNQHTMEKPRRPLSAYEFFCQERKRMVALTDSQLQSIWQERMDSRQKEIYLQQARADRQRYIHELKIWKARSPQPSGAVASFLKSSLSKGELVQANKRGRLQPAIVSCPNLHASPSLRYQAQTMMGGGSSHNATFDTTSMMPSRSQPRPRSRFVAHQMQRLQQGQGLADLASELGTEGTAAFVSAMMPRSQSVPSVQGSHKSTPNLSNDPLMDPLLEFPGF